MTKKTSPSLLEPESTGGEINEKGLTFQEVAILSRIPRWLSHDGFTALIREAIGDSEVQFFVPGRGNEVELLEAKDHTVTPTEFWSEVGRFQRLSVDKTTYKSFVLIAPGVSDTLKPLLNGLRRIKGPRAFYAPESLVANNSYRDFVQIIIVMGHSEAEAAFIYQNVEVQLELSNAADYASVLFQQELLSQLPEYENLPLRILADVFRNMQALA